MSTLVYVLVALPRPALRDHDVTRTQQQRTVHLVDCRPLSSRLLEQRGIAFPASRPREP